MATLTTITGASPLNASNDTYTTFTDDLTETLTNALNDTPADLGNVDTLNWTIEYSIRAAVTDDTYDLAIRIVNGATILAAADAGGTFVSVATNITSTTDTTSGPTAFAYVNTGANKTTWDGASVELQQTYSKTKGADVTAIRVDYFAVDGTYTASIASQTITGAAFTDADSFGAGTVSVGAVSITGAVYTDADTFGAGTVNGSYTVTGAAFTNTPSFGAGTTTSAYDVTGAAFSDGDTFGAGTVTTGPVTITGAAFADADSFGSGTIATAGGTQTITGAVYTDADSFGAGTTTTGAVTITGAAFTDADSFGSGSISAPVSGQTITGAAFSDADSFGVGTVSNVYTISGATYTNSSVFGAGAITVGGVTITGAAFSNASAFGAGSILVIIPATPPASRTQSARAYGRSKAANQGARSETATVKSRVFSVGERNNSSTGT